MVPVFDLNGRTTSVDEWLRLTRAIAPKPWSARGLPCRFPDLSDEPLKAYIGDYGQRPLEVGMRGTFETFRRLLAAGRISLERRAVAETCLGA